MRHAGEVHDRRPVGHPRGDSRVLWWLAERERSPDDRAGRSARAGASTAGCEAGSPTADPRGRTPGGRWWEIVVEFDQPYMPLARAGRARAVRTWTWNVLADRYGQSRAAATSPRHSPDDWPCAAVQAALVPTAKPRLSSLLTQR